VNCVMPVHGHKRTPSDIRVSAATDQPTGKNVRRRFAEMCEMLASGQLHDPEVMFGLVKGAPEMLASPPIQTLRFLPAFFE
jgi:hypothetical protein